MKRTLTALVLALGLTAVSVAPVGCAWFRQPTVQQTSVNSLYTIHKTADAALDAYLDLVVQGKLPWTGVPRVTDAYTHFQKIYNAALVTITSDPNAPVPPSVVEAAADFQTVLTTVKGGN